MAVSSIDKIERHAKKIREGKATVSPGLPYRINEAASIGDGVWQGDLCIEVVAEIPASHVRVDAPKDADRQLVPGTTQGARHALDSVDGVELYRPAEWPNVTQIGPAMLLRKDRVVTHPVHGDVTIAAEHVVLCSYQREWDAESRRERRNAD